MRRVNSPMKTLFLITTAILWWDWSDKDKTVS